MLALVQVAGCGFDDKFGQSTAAEHLSPNVLLIVTDDQRWDQLAVVQRELGEHARFSFLKTPNLDALASEGLRFNNAFVTTSLCSPSRSAILTGQYNHTNGITDNQTPFSPRQTWATVLQTAGYETAYMGKWHHGGQWERPGFDHVASFAGQGNYENTVFRVNGRPVKTRGYVDERTVDFAIDYLEGRGERPFAMMVGLKAVHQPFTPMNAHKEQYALDRVLPAANWNAQPPWMDPKYPVRRKRPADRPIWMDILRTLSSIDHNVGRLMTALDELGLTKNTVVIFTSDNGYLFGEHGLGDKRAAYEDSIRVPLIVRFPSEISAGKISDAMVLNIDLAPTILDLAGQEAPGAIQGKSLRPLFSEEPEQWREVFLYEYWQEFVRGEQRSFTRIPTILAIRTNTHKLVTYPDNRAWTELYDLRKDPGEARNLAGYRASRKTLGAMCDQLQELLVETGYMPRMSSNKLLVDLAKPGTSYQELVKGNESVLRPPLYFRGC